jgi:hypothetical protein
MWSFLSADADGWSAPAPAPGPDETRAFEPRLTAGEDGTLLLTWRAFSLAEKTDAIAAALMPPDASAWKALPPVERSENIYAHVTAIDGEGTPVLVLELNTEEGLDIVSTAYGAGGSDGGRTDDEDPDGRDDEDVSLGRERSDDETYESPQYGYTLAYDLAEWDMNEDDEDLDDDYDQVSFSHDLGFVVLVGDPDYRPSQLDDCVADYRAGLEQAEGVSRVREMRGEEGEEEDRAWAAFTYEFDTGNDEPLDVVRYIECRASEDVAIVVLQTLVAGEYEELSAAREELLEGLEAA